MKLINEDHRLYWLDSYSGGLMQGNDVSPHSPIAPNTTKTHTTIPIPIEHNHPNPHTPAFDNLNPKKTRPIQHYQKRPPNVLNNAHGPRRASRTSRFLYRPQSSSRILVLRFRRQYWRSRWLPSGLTHRPPILVQLPCQTASEIYTTLTWQASDTSRRLRCRDRENHKGIFE